MDKIILTSYEKHELQSLIFDCLRVFHKHNKTESSKLEIDNERPLTIEEACDFLALTKQTIYAKTSKGELKHYKKGKRLYFLKKDLMDYLKEGLVKTNSEIREESHTYTNEPNKRRRPLLDKHTPFLDRNFECVISRRTINLLCMNFGTETTLNDLSKRYSIKELKKVRGLGKVCLEEIIEVFKNTGCVYH